MSLNSFVTPESFQVAELPDPWISYGKFPPAPVLGMLSPMIPRAIVDAGQCGDPGCSSGWVEKLIHWCPVSWENPSSAQL